MDRISHYSPEMHKRLGVNLGYPALGQVKNVRNFLHGETFVVIERHQLPFPFGKRLYGARQQLFPLLQGKG